MSFQNDLKRYKARHYNTTKEIGALLGVSQRTAYRLLSGEKVPTKKQAEYFASILAKNDPDLFAAAKSILPSGVSDDFFRDTLSDLRFTLIAIKETSEHVISLSLEVEKAKKYQRETQTELGIIWSELRAQKAEIDRLSQAKPNMWQQVINFIRGTN